MCVDECVFVVGCRGCCIRGYFRDFCVGLEWLLRFFLLLLLRRGWGDVWVVMVLVYLVVEFLDLEEFIVKVDCDEEFKDFFIWCFIYCLY